MSLHYYPFISRLLSVMNTKEIFNFSQDNKILFTKPFVTVARQPGSLGRPIAAKVAEKLNFRFLDEEIIDDIAESTKKRKAIIQAIDERSRTRIEDFVHSILNKEYVDDFTYIKELTKVILAHIYQGNVVIVGRGASFISPFEKGLHINIVAPDELRIQRTMDFDKLTHAQAERQNKKITESREAFIRQYFRKDAMRCVNFDLSINTQSFSIDEAADLVIEAFYKKFPRIERYRALLSR